MADETQYPTTTTDADGSGNAGTDERRFTQAELDQHIAARLERERKTAADKATKERADAEAKKRKEQGEWEAAAVAAEARAAELEAQQTTASERLDALDATLRKQLKAQTADWPQEAKDALPKEADALELAAAIDRLRPLATKLLGGVLAPGSTRSPRPAGTDKQADTDQLKNELLRAGHHVRF